MTGPHGEPIDLSESIYELEPDAGPETIFRKMDAELPPIPLRRERNRVLEMIWSVLRPGR